MRRLLTLDLATTLGWASAPVDVQTVPEIKHGTYTLPSTGEDVGRFLVAYNDWLDAMIGVEDPAMIVYEAPILNAGKTPVATARKLIGLASHTEYLCSVRGVQCREVNIGTVKKELSGHGRAEKHEQVAAARKLGFNVKDHNDADACGIWMTALKIYKPADYRRLFRNDLFHRAG